MEISLPEHEARIWEERVYERMTPLVRAPELVRQTTKGWFIARFLRPQAHERVLDVGCGLGEFSLLCAGQAREVLGVDASPTAVAAARCAANELGIANVSFMEGDVYELTKIAGEPDSFDKIVCFDLLEHLSDPENVLEQIHALLRPGGRALAYTNCYGRFSARYLHEWLNTGGQVGELWGIDRRDHHLVRFTPQRLRAMTAAWRSRFVYKSHWLIPAVSWLIGLLDRLRPTSLPKLAAVSPPEEKPVCRVQQTMSKPRRWLQTLSYLVSVFEMETLGRLVPGAGVYLLLEKRASVAEGEKTR